MAIMMPPQSAWSKEMAKWEQRPVMIGDSMIMPLPKEQGGRGPYEYQPYPKMLYKAGRPNGINVEIIGSVIVHDEAEERLQKGQGWCNGQPAAIEAVHRQDQELAVLAANRNFHDRRMSEQARAEAHAAEVQSSQHLAAIPETPIKRRGRKPKAAPVPEA